MQRNLSQLADQKFNLIVVGAGIYGVTIAWDAALRGLSVALIDKGDFGNSTSANSLKTIHGGLRYLQDADLKLVRTMIHERMVLMRIAPHLVHPLPCLIPTYNKLTKSKPALRVALAVNDLLCYDKNRLPDPQKRLSPGRVVSREECLAILPGLANHSTLTGGAIWYDAQMHNSERTTLSFALSAASKGAVLANYVEAVKFLTSNYKVTGIGARDVLSGNEFNINADLVVNTAGPWINQLLGFINHDIPKIQLSIAINLVVPQIISNFAVGVKSHPYANGSGKKSQMLFIAPWRNYSIVGTKHLPFNGHPDDFSLSEETLLEFIDDINSAYPAAALTRQDIQFIHWGFLPAEPANHPANNGNVKLVRRGKVFDHQQNDGLAGLITVAGVKYTSARYVAQKAVDLAASKLERDSAPCLTHITPLINGNIDRFDDFVRDEVKKSKELFANETVRHLILNYGSEYPQLLKYVEENPRLREEVATISPVTKMEIVHAVRSEMAIKLADVIFRRTELGSAGHPGQSALQTCATIMADELKWDNDRLKQELDEVKAIFDRKT